MMTYEEIKELVSAVSYKPGWTVALRREECYSKLTGLASDRIYIQVHVADWTEAAVSPYSGERQSWRGGKRYLSYHMCRQEIVGACLDAIKSAEMHELHEWFRYKGRSIFNPHIDPDALVEVVKFKKNLSVRKDAMSMGEQS